MIIYYTHNFTGQKGESHRLLELAIGKCLGDPAAAQSLCGSITKTGNFGKPVIPSFSPFSISHSGRTWAVLIADTDCGLDIQYYRPCNEKQIADRFYAPEDARAANDEPAFFKIWARREALIKALGGSVAETDLPSVLSDKIVFAGRMWHMEDAVIPGTEKLAAALCAEDIEGAPDCEVIMQELDYRND